MISLILAATVAMTPTCADLPKLEAQYRTIMADITAGSLTNPIREGDLNRVVKLTADRDAAFDACSKPKDVSSQADDLDRAFVTVSHAAQDQKADTK